MTDNGKKLQAAKRRVFRLTLAPAGFEKGKGMFVRRVGEQVQAFEIQTATFGGVYFVNLAFSYALLPGFSALYQGGIIDFHEFHILDFLMHQRMEYLMEDPYPWEWAYGGEDTENNLQLNAKNAISILDAWAQRWGNPIKFMEALPPELVIDEVKRLRTESYESVHTKGLVTALPLGAKWGIDHFNLACGLAIIAKSAARIDRARAYLSAGRMLAKDDIFVNALDHLEDELETVA